MSMVESKRKLPRLQFNLRTIQAPWQGICFEKAMAMLGYTSQDLGIKPGEAPLKGEVYDILVPLGANKIYDYTTSERRAGKSRFNPTMNTLVIIGTSFENGIANEYHAYVLGKRRILVFDPNFPWLRTGLKFHENSASRVVEQMWQLPLKGE